MKLPSRFKWGLLLLQLFLLTGSVWLLYSKLNDEALWPLLKSAWQSLQPWQYVLIVLLSLCFWAIDTFLWKSVLKPFVVLPFASALRYNIIAQSAGVLTPLLVGDYGLRSYFLRNDLDSRQNTFVTLAYQMVKVSTRIIIGFAALIFLSFQSEWRFLAIVLAAGLLIVGVLSIKRLVIVLAKTRLVGRFLGDRERLDFSKLRLKITVVPATLLFATFSLQTALLIHWVVPDSDFLQVYSWVIVTYSVTSFLPPMSFFDPLVKSAFGALLYVQVASADVLLFAFTITWVVNRGIPACVSGLLFRRLSGLQRTSNSTT